MSRRIAVGLLACLLILTLVGCRNVWVHPEATKEMYENDIALCQYGAGPDAGSSESATSARRQIRRDWKHCMREHGWHTKAAPRDARLWSAQ